MAILTMISPPPLLSPPPSSSSSSSSTSIFPSSSSSFKPIFASHCLSRPISIASHLCAPKTPTRLDKSALTVAEAASDDELWATSCLRIRSFYDFHQSSFGIEFAENGEDRVVVGTLDLNQCLRLPDEITGMKPQGIGADFARAYLSNVCVAKELQRNGLAHALIVKSKMIAEDWGISDLYVHVTIDNEPAKKLYMKSGFVYENDEPAWQARFLDRPRRILLWTEIPNTLDL
ncbi:uncharacterized protein LOC114266688 isoform X2 [Camellia sinensis]|uniref:uncharacterized protein LOC114266688 isoform X2 n=1 Tax=Camellia sinensis TaxID=4442 RepID=UPI001036AA97|nr:uncharacterized protein LOC114266688 isoform X2 [Camellia sinensis]